MEVKILLNPKKLQGEKQNLAIRFTENRKVNYLNLGIKVKPSQFKNGRLAKEFLEENEVIQKFILLAEKTIIKMVDERLTGFQAFRLLFEQIEKPQEVIILPDFYSYTEMIIARLKEQERFGNVNVYKATLSKFKKYYPTLLFKDITIDLLKDLKAKMVKEGLKGNSQSVIFRTASIIFNCAIGEKLIDYDIYPFKNTINPKGFSATNMTTRTKHRVLNDAELELIKSYCPTNPRREFSKDMFLFSYYANGANITDISKLKESSIINNRITYIRAKTSIEYSIKINTEISNIIMKYKGRSVPYLFPILKKDFIKPSQVRDRIRKITKQLNDGLKEISNELGIDKPITTYWARHSMASRLQRKDVNLAVISKALGHTSLKTTQIYLEGFGNNEIDKILEDLL